MGGSGLGALYKFTPMLTTGQHYGAACDILRMIRKGRLVKAIVDFRISSVNPKVIFVISKL